MKPCLTRWATLVMVALTLSATRLPAQTPIDAYLSPHTIGGVRVRLDRVDLEGLKQQADRLGIPEDLGLDRALPIAQQMLAQLRQTGLQELWVLVDTQRIGEQPPVFLTWQQPPGADQLEQAQKLLQSMLPPRGVTVHPQDDHLVICSARTWEAIDPSGAERAGDVAARELPNSLVEDRNQVLTVFVAPSADQRRVLLETLPGDVPPLNQFDAKVLVDSTQWLALFVSQAPRLQATLQMETLPGASPATVAEETKQAIQAVIKATRFDEQFPKLSEFVQQLPIQVEPNAVTMRMSLEDDASEALVRSLLIQPLQQARAAAQRSQSMNNMKQIMLAFHNYYAVHKGMPPRVARDADGKPLLSWRVYLLPYLEQAALYNAFHLDEPWDSEHNLKLAQTVVPVYRSPGTPNLKPGLTNYVVVAGEDHFLKEDGKRDFREMTDGTSNSIAVLEVDAEHAVPWTKPDDWELDADHPMQGLLFWESVFLAGFGDGSVRAIAESIDPQTLRNLFQINDGKVVDLSR